MKPGGHLLNEMAHELIQCILKHDFALGCKQCNI